MLWYRKVKMMNQVHDTKFFKLNFEDGFYSETHWNRKNGFTWMETTVFDRSSKVVGSTDVEFAYEVPKSEVIKEAKELAEELFEDMKVK